MLDVTSEDNASLFYCQLMDWWILHSSMMKIMLDVFDVKVFIKAMYAFQVLPQYPDHLQACFPALFESR